jgi:hypothetical protein
VGNAEASAASETVMTAQLKGAVEIFYSACGVARYAGVTCATPTCLSTAMVEASSSGEGICSGRNVIDTVPSSPCLRACGSRIHDSQPVIGKQKGKIRVLLSKENCNL